MASSAGCCAKAHTDPSSQIWRSRKRRELPLGRVRDVLRGSPHTEHQKVKRRANCTSRGKFACELTTPKLELLPIGGLQQPVLGYPNWVRLNRLKNSVRN